MYVIFEDSTYSRIKTDKVYKGAPGDPIVKGTTFRLTVHGRNYPSDGCWFSREVHDWQQLFSLENSQLEVHKEFMQSIVQNEDRRYEVKVPWIPGAQLSEINTTQSRLWLKQVEKKLENIRQLRKDYPGVVYMETASSSLPFGD